MSELFKLTKTQIYQLEKLIKDFSPSGHFPFEESDQTKWLAAVYNQYSGNGILILTFYDDDRFSVTDLDGIALNGPELNAKLIELTSSNHLPRIDKGTNGKINSVNTIANGPDPKLLSKIDPTIRLSLAQRIANCNDAMQAAKKDLSELTDIEFVQFVDWQMKYADECRRIAHTRNIAGFKAKFSDITTQFDEKQEKKKIKIRKADKSAKEAKTSKSKKPADNWQFIPNEWNRDLTPNEIKFLRNNLGIDPNTNQAKVEEYKRECR